MKKINVPVEIKDLGEKFLTSDIWFVCADKSFKKVLRPKRYKNIERGEYLRELEKEIRMQFPYHEKDTSFLRSSMYHATNISRPDQILEREEYTYYFKLLPSEIKKSLFVYSSCNSKTYYLKGVQGLADVLKLWYADDADDKDIQVIIPFKVKPQYYIPELSKRIFYHGSNKRFNELKKNSYVTPYKEDAIKFAIPWSSEELLFKDEEMAVLGRPPAFLRFKRNVEIEDSNIFLYSVKGLKTIPTSSNSGHLYPWNRMTLEEASEENKSLKLERKILSWKKELSLNNVRKE